MPQIVAKYGGSVLNSGDAFAKAADYAIKTGAVCVTSAMEGLTKRFEDIYALSITDRKDAAKELASALEMYRAVAEPLPSNLLNKAMEELGDDFKRLTWCLEIGAQDAFEGSPDSVHSPTILKYYIVAHGRDASILSGPDAGFMINEHRQLYMEAARANLKENIHALLNKGKLVIVGGYLGRHYETKQHMLGARNINDAFAAEAAAAIGASWVEIIKDVEGVYRVPPEFGDYGLLEKLSYDEARKMSWRGSPVLHPSAIRIAQNSKMPIIVKNMTSKGTVVCNETQTTNERFVAALVPDKAFMVTVADDIMDTPEGRGYLALILQFEMGTGSDVGVFAADFGGISYTISLADKKRKDSGEKKMRLHNEALMKHLNSHGYRPKIDGQEVGVITVVGDSMQKRPRSTSYLSDIIGRRGVSLRASVQSDEKPAPPSITFIVDADNLHASVKALASELFS